MTTRTLLLGSLLLLGTLGTSIAGRPRSEAAWQPGLGEFMVGIQRHHAALFFAGKAANWELASFELKELEEGFDDAKEYQPVHEKVDVKTLLETIVPPATKLLHESIEKADRELFARGFETLTGACTGCHQAANVPYVRIIEPTAPPTVNQRYEK